METTQITQHYSQQFNADLDQIRDQVVQMGELVATQLQRALEALQSGTPDQAQEVIAQDYQVNAYDVDIDEQCTRILALRQPTASDLRLVLAVIKTTADLERIGDEAKRIARMAARVTSQHAGPNLNNRIEHLGHQVATMLQRALQAFMHLDIEEAIAVAREDERIDREYEGLMRESMTYMMEDPRAIPKLMDIIWSARSLERIGDRCCNICEYILYFVKGKDVRHTSLEKIQQTIGHL
jgi:phosphate transport system protein